MILNYQKVYSICIMLRHKKMISEIQSTNTVSLKENSERQSDKIIFEKNSVSWK